jgi:hypothetical protein
VKSGIEMSFQILENIMIIFGRRICLSGDETLKKKVLQEAHELRLTTHPGSNKMYWDLKEFYWWLNMKKEVDEYVAK